MSNKILEGIKKSGLFIAFWLLLLIPLAGEAQTDSSAYEVYDIIYLKEGGILKGNILSFDDPTGFIVFQDVYGRKYSLGREQYKYFEENKVFPVKKKRRTEILPRKENEWEINLGLSTSYLWISHDFTPDQYILNGVDNLADIPFCLKVGAMKYINRVHSVGLTSEFVLFQQNRQYFNGGLKYRFHYDKTNSNVGYYLPVELVYNTTGFKTSFQVADTVFTDNGWTYPADKELEVNIKSIALNLGHGFAFILPNKRSVQLEFNVSRHFNLSQKITGNVQKKPESSFGLSGIRMSLLFNI